MKKEYFNLEIEFILLTVEDIVTASPGIGDNENDNPGDDIYDGF
jgi:hypothetical protein